MPINIQYIPDTAATGQIAYDAGRGLFLQNQDRFNLEQQKFGLDLNRLNVNQDQYDRSLQEQQRQYDTSQGLAERKFSESQREFNSSFGEQQRQFDQGLQFKAQLAALQDYQQQRKLGQQQSQFDDQLQFSRQKQAAEQARQQQLQAIQQRKDLQAVRQQKESRLYNQGLTAAQKVSDYLGKLNPDQQQQVIGQWMDQYGTLFGGQFPFQSPPQQPQVQTREMAVQGLEQMPGMLPGEAAGLVDAYGTTGPDGAFVVDRNKLGDAITKIRMDREKRQADNQRAEDEARAALFKENQARLEAEQKAQEKRQRAEQEKRQQQLQSQREASEAAYAAYQTAKRKADSAGDDFGEEQANGFNFPRPANQQEIDQLPLGTYYINTENKLRRKGVEMVPEVEDYTKSEQYQRDKAAPKQVTPYYPQPTTQEEVNQLPDGTIFLWQGALLKKITANRYVNARVQR